MKARGIVRRMYRAVRRKVFWVAATGWLSRLLGRTENVEPALPVPSTDGDDSGPGFDERFKVDTEEPANLADLRIATPDWHLGVDYHATPPAVFRQIMAALPIDHTTFDFVDCGSGKGRVLMMAAEYPFNEVIGVEHSAELHAIAERNLTNYHSPTRRCFQVRSECCDIREFQLPPYPLVLYLYNPFLEDIVRSLLQTVQQSLIENPRPIFFLYFNPHFYNLFDDTPLVSTFATGRGWRIYAAGPQ